MKMVDLLTEKLFAETMGVLNGTVNAQSGLVSARLLDSLIKSANVYSRHQLNQKKIPSVMLFDKEYSESQMKNLLKGNQNV
jgi:hypothetical protein